MPKRGENIYRRKDGRWEGRYISGRKPDGSARYTSIYGKSYREVKALLEKRKGDKSRSAPSSALTVKSIMSAWLTMRVTTVKESSFQRYETLINCHILPRLGGIRISCLTAEILADFVLKLQKEGRLDGHGGLSEKSVSDIMSVLRSALRLAGRNNAINVEALFDIKAPIARQKRVETLRDAECEALTNSIFADPDIYGAAYLLALNLGLRIGEICGLKWSDISLPDRLLYVNRTAIRIKSGSHTRLTVQTPKTESALREIPIPAKLLSLLLRLKTNHSPDVFILTGSLTLPQDPRTLRAKFKRYLKEHGMRELRFHSLRHTFATRCIELGYDVKTLSELLGHKDIKTTLQLYVHTSLLHKREVVEAVAMLPKVM